MTTPDIHRIAAFSDGAQGGNPAGVVISRNMPDAAEMQRIAADVGYSETVFAVQQGDGWRVRYFSPTEEVAFCGHATIALGSVLADQQGAGTFLLMLNGGDITVEAARGEVGILATLTSPPTRSGPADPELVREALQLFSLSDEHLDRALPPGLAHAGNDHLILLLKDRETLANAAYNLAQGAELMRRYGLTTISLLWARGPQHFDSRNAFAIGGVMEDPATGAAAAALGGYLRDLDWPHGGAIEIVQGEDMGARSILRAQIGEEFGSGIRVSGAARLISV